ncbi:MAG: cysteine desulfurase family protein [Halanaerobium sp.]
MIYLDYNATTPISEEVAGLMKKMIKNYGNPSSSHKLGIKAKKAVEEARNRAADMLNCSAEEIVFTSGGSESNNMAIKGVAYTYHKKGNHIITSQIEHPAVLEPCRFLEKNGYQITQLPVDKNGIVKLDKLKEAIREDTILISIMHANNETGSIQPIKEIAEIAAENNVLMHTDAAQSVGKIKTDVKEMGVDFLSLAGHKLYGPKGIGVLYIKNGIEIEPLIHGAGHESGRRAGTENVIHIAGLGKACEQAVELFAGKKNNSEVKTPAEIKELRDYFQQQLKSIFAKRLKLNGHPKKRLPNTLNVSFLDFRGEQILDYLEGVAVSTGSACHEDSVEISSVLKAMGLSQREGLGAVRFSLGKYTIKSEIDQVLSQLKLMG